METLEYFYNIEFRKIDYLARKKHITKTNTIIYGPRFSGKSYMLFDLLSNIEPTEYLFLDFNDFRFDKNLNDLENFIEKNNIKVLAIDNFDYSIDLPKKTINIITSNTLVNLKGYKKVNLLPLDFEEYISFDNKHQNITHIFNEYLKNTTFLNMLHTPKHKLIKKLQDNIKLFTNSELELEILKIFFLNCGLKLSLFQVFNLLKDKMKISKDKFYEITNLLEEKQYIFFVEKYNQPKSAKKIYALDYNIKLALSFEKNLSITFENMIFLELLKRGKKVFYTDFLTFYKPSKNLGIISIAFGDIEIIEKKINKIYKHLHEDKITKIYIITIAQEANFNTKEIKCEVLPFWKWAVMDEE